MMAYSEDHIALAAEYALGTLDAEERAQVETMMSVDKDFTAMVTAWQHKLGALNQMVGPVEPRPELWEKIRAAVGHTTQQAPIVFAQPAPLATAPETEAARAIAEAAGTLGADTSSVDNSNVIQLAANARRWRAIATAASAIAAALVVMIGVGLSMPDLLPDSIRRKEVQVVETRAPPASTPSAQYVALLQKDGGGPAFILTVDGATRNFTVRKVGASAEPGSSFELWLISDKLPKPRSLGVIGGNDFTSRPVLASYDADMVRSATYAVTVEQAGGSPDGSPHSTPVFTGKLLETVPPAAAPVH
jgi:anti-sigma-K factor RskA